MTNYKQFIEDDIGFVHLVDKMENNTALKVVNSARISYNNTKEDVDDKDISLIKYLWDHQHTSPFRHSFFTFHVKAPIFVFRQWMKYQVGSTWAEYTINGESVSLEMFDLMYDTDKGCSWNEISSRYSKLKPEFYIPTKMRANASHGNKQASHDLPEDFPHRFYRDIMQVNCETQYEKYINLIEKGVAREIARIILPQNIYSEAYWTVSLQGVLHFLKQRLHKDAQYEIRLFAECIEKSLEDNLKYLTVNED